MRIIHIAFSKAYRLRLEDGTYVFMAWHWFCGPTFYHDRAERRIYDEWYENPQVCRALEWFIKRGKKA